MSSARGLAVIIAFAALAFAAPASAEALVIRDTAEHFQDFVGAGCGSRDSVSFRLPRRSSRARVVSPHAGAVLNDIVSGEPVATVTVARIKIVGRRRIAEFTVTGSHSTCTNPQQYAVEGWAVAENLKVRFRRRVRVFFSSLCYNSRYKPRSVILTCADAGLQLRRMRWHRWNGRVARGRGLARVNLCDPFCAAGRIAYFKVRARLYRPRFCSSVGRYHYTRLAMRFVGAKPPGPRGFRQRFPCP